jgi:7-carboxy-7-deazaguanine synthase
MGTLLVAECVAPTFQTAGPSAGQLATLVRLAGCNLACPSCDVPFTWDHGDGERRRLSVDLLVEWVMSCPARLVVITGGEPLLQPVGLVELATALTDRGYRVEIETDGTLAPAEELVAATHLFVVAPKLGRFTADASRLNTEVLGSFAASGRAVFCVVVQGLADLAELVALEHRLGLYPIWVAPEGSQAERVLSGMRWLAPHARDLGWNLSGRLHVLLDEPRRSSAQPR